MTLTDWLRGPWGRGSALDDVPVLWLGEPAAGEEARVGGKAANLSRLAARWPVPPGFCVPIELHRRLPDTDAPGRALRRLLAGPYRRLGGGLLRRQRVAVRSSAVGEDSEDASFAGQHDTVLNAVGVRAVADAVLTCCASTGSERARSYREARGLDGDGRMAVLVQELIDADVSAVVFSANPVTGARDEIMVNASWGLGEAVVAGAVTPDTYVLARDDLAVLQQTVAVKDVEVVCTRGGTRTVDVPSPRRDEPALDPGQCRELAALAVELERDMGWPVDLECAYRDGEVFLLQCRPITALATS